MKPFNVFGKTIVVEVVSELDNAGEFCAEKSLIKVLREKNKDEQMLHLLHEFVHAVCHRTGLTQAIPSELEEVVCEVMSHAFYENFKMTRK